MSSDPQDVLTGRFSPALPAAGGTVAVGVVVVDRAGRIRAVNQHIAQLLGYPSAELVGETIGKILPQGREGPGAGDTPAPCRSIARRRDGSEVSVQVDVTPVDRAPGGVLVVTIVDVAAGIAAHDLVHRRSHEQASFERLVTELSARFINIRSRDIDETIIDSLRQICESLDLDRSTWWQFSAAGDDAVATHTWVRPEYRLVKWGESAGSRVPGMLARARNGEMTAFARVDDLPDPVDRDTQRSFGSKSGAAIPFTMDRRVNGVLGFSAIRAERAWPPEILGHLRLVTGVIGQALARAESGKQLQRAMSEMEELRSQLVTENVQLRRELRVSSVPALVVAESPATRRVLEQVESVASTNATVLLLGETGSGKEVFAQAIHRKSERHRRPMITVSCGAIPTPLIESELFGRERGAYTGALARQVGRFELAHESTLFLDEIGELPLETQVKLLRALQERVIERLGNSQPIKIDVRIIAATNRDLEKAVADRMFRADLFYRLNVFPITVPPLRERVQDIPGLVWAFIEEFSREFRKPIDSISKDSLAALQRYTWPGNVRELRNVIERAVIVARSPRLTVEPPGPAAVAARSSPRLVDVETQQIRSVLESVGWRVRGAGGAAEILGMKPNTLDSRMAKLGIRRPRT